MKQEKWHMHKMGLVDFWHFAEQEFYFSDGHIMLRGGNGSGKSVTLQSFIPLLLDGNKSSERLDTFGSKARKMETYLLDEEGGRDNRIGYLYLEFKKGEYDLYTTIGMGIHARKNNTKRIDTWYFVIEDNRRINKDIFLFKNGLAITKQELRYKIQHQLIEKQKQYMEKVNQVLFGFDNIVEYKEAIDLLLQVRSPKLNNSFKPTLLNDALSNSLLPLSEEDLRPMSEAISSMDDTKNQLDTLQESIQSSKLILNEYTKYNYAVLFNKLDTYRSEENKEKEIVQELKADRKKDQVLEEKSINLSQTRESLEQEQVVLIQERDSLASSDIINLKEEILRLKMEQEQLQKEYQNKKEYEEIKDNRYFDYKKQCKQQVDTLDEQSASIHSYIEEMDEICEDWPFKEHALMKDEVLSTNLFESYNYDYTKEQLKNVIDKVQLGSKQQVTLSFYQNELKNMGSKYLEVQDSIEKKERELAQYEALYQDIIEEYKEKFVKWNQNNVQLELSPDDMQEIMQYLLSYENTQDYKSILTKIDALKRYGVQTLESAKWVSIAKRKEVSKLLEEKEKQLHTWEVNSDIEPFKKEECIRNREFLTRQNIPFIPLYTLLDFDPTLSEVEQNRIEEMLEGVGLLDVLLVHEEHREVVMGHRQDTADTYLFISKDIDALQTIYLSKEVTLNVVLSEVGALKQQEFAIDEHCFSAGVMEGILAGNVKAKYIGKESREQYRQMMIATLSAEVQVLENEYESIQKEIESVETALILIEKEYQNIPEEADLQSAYQSMKDSVDALVDLQVKLQSVEREKQELRKKINPIVHGLQQIASELSIEVKQDSFRLYEESACLYRDTLNSFIETHKAYCMNYELFLAIEESMESLLGDLDVIRSELQVLSTRSETGQMIFVKKEEQLQMLGVKEIETRLDVIQLRLLEIPKQLTVVLQDIGSTNESIKNAKNTITMLEKQLSEQTHQKDTSFEILKNEVSLGFFIKEDWTIRDLIELQKNNPVSTTKERASTSLQNVYHLQNVNLQEYYLSMSEYVFKDTALSEEPSPRLIISAKYQGKKIMFEELVDILLEGKQTLELLVQKADRRLFEEILISTISKKIRSRIQSSRHWVQVMNEYMNAMNTSSGLKLNLVWKPSKATAEEQLDIKELVSLLERDVVLLKEKDKKDVSKHFRSKIAQARQLSATEGNTQSFHQTMREVMDYRKWFTFTIMYQKTGEAKKELTNNAFAVFSGGEKAMSMYVPLFSAVAAKFDGGRKEAPVIIALDEAFAGVDENNIDSMFELIEKFEFDYIMNSQILWGDSPFVKALSIYELYRSNNAKFITVMQYHWNGLVREYINR